MRFIPIEEFEKPVTQPRFIPIEEFEPSVRAPEEFPPGIAGAGPMVLSRDFSIPVETPPVAGLQPVQETEPILPAEASISSFVKGREPEGRADQPKGLQFFTEVGRGAMRAATSDLPSMWQSATVLKDVGAAATIQQRLNLFDQIERGEITSEDQLRGLDLTSSQARSYLATNPETRSKMRQRLESELGKRKELVDAAVSTINAYKKDAQKYQPAVGRPRDIGSVTDFANWVGSTIGAGAVQMVPLMLAAAATGGVGLGVTAVGMGVGESVLNRLDFIQKEIKDLPVEQQADKILNYLQTTGDTSLLTGILSGSLDVVLGPAARLVRMRSGAIAPAATRGEAAIREVKAIPGQMAQEGLTGGAQQAIQVAGAVATGETPEFASRENLLQILEAVPTEAVGSLGGSAVNVGLAAAQRPAAGRIEPTLPEVMPEAPGRAEPTIETEPAVEGRPEPTLPAEEEPVVLRPTRRGPPVEETVEDVPAIPGMPSIEEPSYVFTPIEAGVTPVAPAVEEPPVEPIVTPTPAAAATPETPTVPPVAVPKMPEPEAPQLEAQGLATVEVPLDQLNLVPPAEPKTGDVVQTIPLPNNMETRVFKTSDGYGTGLFDKDSGNFVDGSITRFKGDDARAKAEKKAQEVAQETTPQEAAPETPTETVPETVAEAEPEAPAVAPIVERFASKVQSEGQTSEAFEDADGVQVRTTTSKWQGTTSRANFDELIKYAVASPQKQGRKYSVVLAETLDKSSILTFTTRGYTPTQKRVELVMQLQTSEKMPVEAEAPAVAPDIWALEKTYDDAKAALEALGPEPAKPRTERQFFGKNGREGADPETVRRYDEGVKKYNAWKRKYGKLKKAEVDASNALFRAKQGPALANIEPSLAEQEGDLIFDSQRIREENIQEYARLRRKLAGVPKRVARGEAGPEMQRETTRLLQSAKDLKTVIDITKPRRDTPERFLAKALEEYDKGNISADVLAVIQAAYSKQPGLLNGLMLRVQKQPENGAAAADFNPLAQIVRLFKGTSGVDSPISIRHELVHSLEQMMTPEQRQILVDQWYKSLKKAMDKHQDEKHQRYFKSVLDFMENPTQRNFQTATLNLPSYDMYQYMNPSEYWAVNAEPLMNAQLGTPWNRFKMAVRRLFEGLKDVLGFDNKSAIYKTFKQVMDGDGNRISKDMLLDYIQNVSQDLTLPNIEAPREERERVDELLDEFNRPKVTGRELDTVKSRLMPSTSSIRSTFREMIDNPSQAANMIFGSLNRGIAQARNYLFFSGAGLEEADAKRYANQVRTANDEATATLALDNMLHGNGIAVQFLMQGGLRYNPETKRIEATQADGSMLDVYRLERELKNKLGDERGAMLIQGYLEAKRSKSIRDEMAELAELIEVQKESLDDARARLRELEQQGAADRTIGQQQKVVDGLSQEYNETKEQLDNIVQINEEKVLMSEEEVDAFINQDAAYPELRGMMDAWTATNLRLLGMMRQVRLISQKRYERLAGIKDYVPWQRVQDDDVDVHYIGNPRSATNITKERAFKKGKVERAVDYIPDNMTDNIIRLTQSVLRQYAAGRIVNDYATRTEDGKIKNFAKADRNKGRFDYISDGRRVVVEVKDPLIAEAVYGRDSVDLRAPAAIAAATNFMRRAITVDPFFQMSQVIKDAPTAAIVTGVRNPAALMGSVMTSFAKTVVNADPVADILRANGIGGFQSITRTPEAAIKRKKGLVNRSVGTATLEIMDHIGDASDFAARIAAYKRTMAETGDEALALYRAANVINFNRLGSSGAIRTFVTYVNFANAYLQSIDTLFTALTARGARGRDTKKALGIMAATVAQLTALTLAYSWLVGGDDEYQKLDDATKVRNFFIPKSITGTDSGILIPINTSAAFIFKAMPELTYNMFASQATKTPMDATRYKKAVSEAAADALFGPEPVPSAIRPIVEIAMNRSFFTERSLTPRGTETLEKFQQFTDQTSELGKLLGQAGGLSPIEWDHLIRGTTGVAGMLAQYGSNMIGEYLNVRPESTAKQLPGVGRFIAPEVGRGPEALFYDLHERVRKATSTYKDLEATGRYEKAEKFDAEKNLLIDLSREMNRTEAKLKKINTEIRMLSRGRQEGTAKERRREITELQRDKQELLEGIEMLRKEAGL